MDISYVSHLRIRPDVQAVSLLVFLHLPSSASVLLRYLAFSHLSPSSFIVFLLLICMLSHRHAFTSIYIQFLNHEVLARSMHIYIPLIE